MMNREVLERRRAEMLREAELTRLEDALRAERPAWWASTVAWEAARVTGRLGKFFKTKNGS